MTVVAHGHLYVPLHTPNFARWKELGVGALTPDHIIYLCERVKHYCEKQPYKAQGNPRTSADYWQTRAWTSNIYLFILIYTSCSRIFHLNMTAARIMVVCVWGGGSASWKSTTICRLLKGLCKSEIEFALFYIDIELYQCLYVFWCSMGTLY